MKRFGFGDLVADIASFFAGTQEPLTQKRTREILAARRSSIIKALRAGNTVVDGDIKYEKRIRAARNGVNPATGAKIRIPEKEYVYTKALRSFTDEVIRK